MPVPQVHNLVSTLCNAVGLSCALAAARSGVAAEAADLVGADGSGIGGADVLVATPGRLMAHLAGTSGFSLDFLRFLVRRNFPPHVFGDSLVALRFQGTFLNKQMFPLKTTGKQAQPTRKHFRDFL